MSGKEFRSGICYEKTEEIRDASKRPGIHLSDLPGSITEVLYAVFVANWLCILLGRACEGRKESACRG